MPDYGQPLCFGYFPEPRADRVDEVVRSVQLADQLGLDLVGIQDHPYQSRYLDTWTLLSVLAARTSSIGLFPDVANLPLRPPAVLARAAASLDLLSGGRFDLGLGAGSFWDAVAAMDGPRRSPAAALAAMEEAIVVLRAMWSGRPGLRTGGEHYRLTGAHGGPVPSRPIGIWVGAVGPRMLALTGRLADGWVPSSTYVPPPELPARNRIVDDAATEAGREPRAVRRIYNVAGRITDRTDRGLLDGPRERWVDELTTLALEHGMDSFVLWPNDDPDDQLRRFAAEVAPAVLEAVDAARRSGPGPDAPVEGARTGTAR